MKKSLLLIATALLLAACSGKPEATPAATPTPAATGAAAAPAPAPAAAPATDAAAAGTHNAASENAKVDTGDKAEESKLEKAAPLPAAGQLPAGKWTAGVNYRPLVPAQPTDAAPGKVEVVEMFWYACPHCYALDPYLENWRKSKPGYVEFRRVPITWSDVHRSHARFFYALQALGKEEALHADVFAEMHDRKNYMFMQGNEAESLAAMVGFVKAHGISEADFTNAWNSFTVQTNLQKADDLMRRYKVEGVPLLIVNGKYVTDVNMAGSPDNVIGVVNDLAAGEKAR